MTKYKLERQLKWDGDILNVHDVVRQVSDDMNKQMEDVVLKHFDMDMSDLREYMHDKVKWERKQELAMPRWISVTAMLPEDGADVIAWLEDEHESRMTAANYDHGVWYDCIMHHEEKRVKYWMQKPKPPKEEDNAE